jgi:prophage maintenance system killer protein
MVERLGINHPFVDRHTRLAFTAADVFLRIDHRHLNRVQSDMRNFRFAIGFGDVLDPGEARFTI